MAVSLYRKDSYTYLVSLIRLMVSLQIIWPLELGPISGTEPNFVSIFNVFSEMLRNALSIFEAKHLKILFK